jgi:hypothetical protein
MADLYPGEVQAVTLPGRDGPFQWRQGKEGLHIQRPDALPTESAPTFKIARQTQTP